MSTPLPNAPYTEFKGNATAMLASLVATYKMSDVNPVDYIAETLRAILDGHPASQIEALMPWHFRKTSSRTA